MLSVEVKNQNIRIKYRGEVIMLPFHSLCAVAYTPKNNSLRIETKHGAYVFDVPAAVELNGKKVGVWQMLELLWDAMGDEEGAE